VTKPRLFASRKFSKLLNMANASVCGDKLQRQQAQNVDNIGVDIHIYIYHSYIYEIGVLVQFHEERAEARGRVLLFPQNLDLCNTSCQSYRAALLRARLLVSACAQRDGRGGSSSAQTRTFEMNA
jgi:hypothetical protein